jgi:hypothetical protein
MFHSDGPGEVVTEINGKSNNLNQDFEAKSVALSSHTYINSYSLPMNSDPPGSFPIILPRPVPHAPPSRSGFKLEPTTSIQTCHRELEENADTLFLSFLLQAGKRSRRWRYFDLSLLFQDHPKVTHESRGISIKVEVTITFTLCGRPCRLSQLRFWMGSMSFVTKRRIRP